MCFFNMCENTKKSIFMNGMRTIHLKPHGLQKKKKRETVSEK